jgi:hypothetical protein
LLLDFEKAFDRIEWSFLFEALAKLGFCPQWIQWVNYLYGSATSAIKLNGTKGSTFPLARSMRQGCPLSPYLFILATNVLGHMLDDHRHEVEGLALPGGGKITDQTFADDTALYLQGTHDNMERALRSWTPFARHLEQKSTGTNHVRYGLAKETKIGSGVGRWDSSGSQKAKG